MVNLEPSLKELREVAAEKSNGISGCVYRSRGRSLVLFMGQYPSGVLCLILETILKYKQDDRVSSK